MNTHNTKKTIAALILAAGRSSRLQHEQESYHKLLLPLGEGTILSHVVDAALASQAHPIILILGYQSAQIRASLTQAWTSLLTPTKVENGLSSPIGSDHIVGTGLAPVRKRVAGTLTRSICICDHSSDRREACPYDASDDFIIIENTAYAQGMSTSLHKGIQSLLNRNDQGKLLNQSNQGQHPGRAYDGVLVLLGDQPLITSALLNQLIESKYTTGKRIIAPFYNGQRRNPVLFDADLFPELLAITGDEGARSVIAKHQTEIGMLNIDDPQLCYDVDTWDAYEKVLHSWKQLH